MDRRFGFVLAACVAALTPGIGEGVARACGGCFAPPETPTVVTDHRMVLSVSRDQTTLYDQIRYQGDPRSFAWVLPIAGVANVGLSSNLLFNVLDLDTQTQIVPPRPPFQADSASAGGSSSGGTSGTSGGVTVLKAEQVGPYETVQLRSTDPQALTKWLANNGFAIGEDVKPVIAAYVGEGLDFLALKLVPGAGIREMRPIRVTTAGASPTLPLRMVAAGAGASLGITLWVVAEGRYEPQNFPWFRIDDGSLVWDFAAGVSNYKTLRSAFSAAFGGRGWELESSIPLGKELFKEQVRGAAATSSGSDGYTATDGGLYGAKSAEEVREADLETLFAGIPAADARVTRVRADLARSALGVDLALRASTDQAVLPNVRQVSRVADGSLAAASTSGGFTSGSVPSASGGPTASSSGASTSSSGGATTGGVPATGSAETFTCSNAAREPAGVAGWGALALGAALALRARRRRPST
jgi:MYXO-CTERM domain-containing protein